MGNTEIFKLCETSSKKQCPDCNFLHWDIGIVCLWDCSYQQVGQEELRRLINSRLRRQKKKKTSSVVPNVELPSNNECTRNPRRCCRKLVNPSMGSTQPIWKDGKVGYSSWIKVFKDQRINARISLKQNEKWKDCRWTCERVFRRKYTHSSDTTIKKVKKPTIRRTWIICLSNRCPNRMENLSSEVTAKFVVESNTFVLVNSVGSRTKVGIFGDLQPGLNSSDFLFRDGFSHARKWTPWQSKGV